MNPVVAHVVYFRGKPVALYRERYDADWLSYLLGGRHTRIKALRGKVLLKVMQKMHRRRKK